VDRARREHSAQASVVLGHSRKVESRYSFHILVLVLVLLLRISSFLHK
jgi:hypothetical protein